MSSANEARLKYYAQQRLRKAMALTRAEWDSFDIASGRPCPDCGVVVKDGFKPNNPPLCDCPRETSGTYNKIHLNGHHHQCKKPN